MIIRLLSATATCRSEAGEKAAAVAEQLGVGGGDGEEGDAKAAGAAEGVDEDYEGVKAEGGEPDRLPEEAGEEYRRAADSEQGRQRMHGLEGARMPLL